MYLWGESLGESCIYREKKRGIEKRNQGTVNGRKEKKWLSGIGILLFLI